MLKVLFATLFFVFVGVFGHSSGENQHPPSPVEHDKHFAADIISPDAEHIKLDFQTIFGFMFGDFTEEDLQFSYFTIHDYDHNSKLDGLELMSALRHINHTDSDGTSEHSHPERTIDQDMATVDLILSEDDRDNDGFISFAEYKKGREIKKAVK